MRPRVLISRPGERAGVLCRALAVRGVEVATLDVMRLEALAETPAMRQAWLDFDNFQRVVVASPFAARCLAEGLDRYWPQLPLGPRFYALGAGTAQVLNEQLDVRVHLPSSEQGSTSEALLALPSLQRLSSRRVLLAAGEACKIILRPKASVGVAVERDAGREEPDANVRGQVVHR